MDKNLQRRVTISHKHGKLSVRIERHTQRTMYIVMLAAFTAGFVFFTSVFIAPLLRDHSSTDPLYVLPFLGFIAVWYVIGLRVVGWRAFGIEQIVVEAGTFHWSRRALLWIRNVEYPAGVISEVKPVTPWHGLSNHVEFTARGTRRSVGDMLMHDETIELAHALRHAIGLGG